MTSRARDRGRGAGAATSRRALLVALAAVAGLLAGAVGGLAVQPEPARPGPGSGATPPPGEAPAPSAAELPGKLPARAAPLPAASGQLLLAWTPAGLPEGFADAVAADPAIDRVAIVWGDPLGLVETWDAAGAVVDRTEPGFVVPIDALAIDPEAYAGALPAADGSAVRGLRPGEALLGATSAELRRLGPGSTIELADGSRLVVAAVVDDEVVGAAEVVVDRPTGEQAGISTQRALLVRHRGDEATAVAAVRGALPDATPVRIRGLGETPYLRHGDAVTPQAIIKSLYGEFSHRPAQGRDLEVDPEWVADHIVTAEVPLLGEVRCHRGIVDALRDALAEIEQEGLGYLVDPDGYAGCFAPRLIDVGGAVSRHAWGIAFDLNWPKNPMGIEPVQDPRLVAAFERRGFTWGGTWLVPDGAHFEATAR